MYNARGMNFCLYQLGELGTKKPFFFCERYAKNTSDFWIHAEKRNKKLEKKKSRFCTKNRISVSYV